MSYFSDYVSPFSRSKYFELLRWTKNSKLVKDVPGGKVDDITVVIGRVKHDG